MLALAGGWARLLLPGACARSSWEARDLVRRRPVGALFRCPATVWLGDEDLRDSNSGCLEALEQSQAQHRGPCATVPLLRPAALPSSPLQLSGGCAAGRLHPGGRLGSASHARVAGLGAERPARQACHRLGAPAEAAGDRQAPTKLLQSSVHVRLGYCMRFPLPMMCTGPLPGIQLPHWHLRPRLAAPRDAAGALGARGPCLATHMDTRQHHV